MGDTNITNILNPNASYFRNIRSEIAEYVENDRNLILDVGCGAGYFGEYLKKTGRAAKVIGIEIDEVATSEASTKLDCVICANLNQTSVIDVLKDFDKASFDYIVCADVLEHLIDPWKVLAELVTYLKPSGRLVVSIPNVRHWSVWLPLILRGQWEYREAGILDRTHLRFFTRTTGLKLITGANLGVVGYQSSIWRSSERLLNRWTFDLFEGWLASQWVFVGKAVS